MKKTSKTIEAKWQPGDSRLWCPIGKPGRFELEIPSEPGGKPARMVLKASSSSLHLEQGMVEITPKNGHRRYKPNGVLRVTLTVIGRRAGPKAAKSARLR